MIYFEVLFLWQCYEFKYTDTFQDFTAILYLSFGKIISSNAIRIPIIRSRSSAALFLFFLATGNLISDSNGTLFHLFSKFCYHFHCFLLKNTFCIRFFLCFINYAHYGFINLCLWLPSHFSMRHSSFYHLNFIK